MCAVTVPMRGCHRLPSPPLVPMHLSISRLAGCSETRTERAPLKPERSAIWSPGWGVRSWHRAGAAAPTPGTCGVGALGWLPPASRPGRNGPALSRGCAVPRGHVTEDTPMPLSVKAAAHTAACDPPPPETKLPILRTVRLVDRGAGRSAPCPPPPPL